MSNTKRITVIAGDLTFRHLIREGLNALGVTAITSADSFDVAQEIMWIATPDLLILEYEVRGACCLDLVHKIRDGGIIGCPSDAPIIVIADFPPGDERGAAVATQVLGAGVTACVSNQFSLRTFIPVVQNALDHESLPARVEEHLPTALSRLATSMQRVLFPSGA